MNSTDENWGSSKTKIQAFGCICKEVFFIIFTINVIHNKYYYIIEQNTYYTANEQM